MYILMIILGVLMIILGVGCIATPLVTLAAAGVYIAIILVASGITGIIAGFKFKIYGVNFIVSIVALVLGVLALIRQGGIETIDTVLIYLFAAWLVFRGATSISLALRFRKLDVSNEWILTLIIGILGVALGIYSFVHPSVSAIAIGMLIGFYFIEEGIDIIAMSRVVKEVSDVEDAVMQQAEEVMQQVEEAVNKTE